VMFALLEKAAADRPGNAAEVIEQLAPFRPAAPRAPRSRERRTTPEPAPVQESVPPRDTPKETRAPKLATIALVEKATSPKEIPTLLAILVIVALSLVAGLATYVIRARSGPSVEPPTTATASAKRN